MRRQNQHLKPIGLSIFYLLLLAFSSCKDSTVTDTSLGNSRVLVVNSLVSSSAIDLYWTGNKLNTSALAYGSSTGYKNMTSGIRPIQIKVNGSNKLLGTDTIHVVRDSSYTYFIYQSNNRTDAVLAEDDLSIPSSGNAKVKFANMSAGLLSADLVITDGPAIASGIGYGNIGSYAELKAGTYNLYLRMKGTTVSVYSIPNINLVSGKIYTIWCGGALNGTGSTALSAQVFIQ